MPTEAKRIRVGQVWTGILILAAVPALASGQDLAYSGSMQFAAGRYLFEERTDSFYFLNGVELTAGRFSVQASFPVIIQSTPWISYGRTPIPSGGNESGEVGRQLGDRGQMGQGGGGRPAVQLPADMLSYETGIADPYIRGNVALVEPGTGRLSVGLGGGIKVPAAGPDEGFGTGEWDYSGGVSLGAFATDRDSVFADLSYQVFGDMPDLAFRNALAYSLSYGRTAGSSRWAAQISVYGMTRILENSDAPLQLSLGFTRFHDSDRSMNFGVTFGLSETVPDIATHVGWRFGL